MTAAQTREVAVQLIETVGEGFRRGARCWRQRLVERDVGMATGGNFPQSSRYRACCSPWLVAGRRRRRRSVAKHGGDVEGIVLSRMGLLDHPSDGVLHSAAGDFSPLDLQDDRSPDADRGQAGRPIRCGRSAGFHHPWAPRLSWSGAGEAASARLLPPCFSPPHRARQPCAPGRSVAWCVSGCRT